MSADRGAQPLIAIGLLTYLRPEMLRAALAGFRDLATPAGTRLLLLVVDNDAGAGARAVVAECAPSLPFPVRYAVEAERGIAAARNRVLTCALEAEADYLAFIDDDEIPEPGWLQALYAALMEGGADAVSGPVYWRLPEGAPGWLKLTAYHAPADKNQPPRPRESCQCGNALMGMHMVRDWGLRFDTRLGLSGGEDSEFFLRGRAMGARYLHVERARLFEEAPPSRLTRKWFFARWLAVSRSIVLIDRLHHGGGYAWRRHFLRSLPRFLSGPAYLAGSLVGGEKMRLKGLKHLAGALGTLAGLLGLEHREYARIHGH